MSDIICRKCGEPWDSHGITIDKYQGDMRSSEVDRFLKGEGCPSCAFGTLCTHCRGTRMEPKSDYRRTPDCATCLDNHYVMVYQAGDSSFGPWSEPKLMGYYAQGERAFDLDKQHVIQTYPGERRLNGWQRTIQIACPDCGLVDLTVCQVCHGDGKWRQPEYDHTIDALESLVEASDEEPIGLMDTFLQGE